jgi:RHS repeat-associated protein
MQMDLNEFLNKLEKAITPSTSSRNSFTYTGREYDEETNLYFYRARYYDPRLGRFHFVQAFYAKNQNIFQT